MRCLVLRQTRQPRATEPFQRWAGDSVTTASFFAICHLSFIRLLRPDHDGNVTDVLSVV